MTAATDIAVVGAGIVGCAAAALLSEAGASVTLFEADGVAAGASGRNSGVLQHPLDSTLEPLYEDSLRLYAELEDGFELPEQAGLLVLASPEEPLRAEMERLASAFPELGVSWLPSGRPHELEPAVAPEVHGYRIETGRPIPPAAATRAFARRAAAAGVEMAVGAAVEHIAITDGRVAGVMVDGRLRAAGAVVVAAGAWTSRLIDPTGSWEPIQALWGVVAEVRLDDPPRHVLEEAGVESLVKPGAGPPAIFSLVTAETSVVGSTFDLSRPDPERLVPAVMERASRYVPALADGLVTSFRACPRPLSRDGRPLLGPVPGIEGLFVGAGHGAWGISLGPGSAQMVVEALLGRRRIPAPLEAARFSPPPPRDPPCS